MFGFIHDIEWMRAYSEKNRKKKLRKNIKKNYKWIYREIKSRAKQGMNVATIRFPVYNENVRRLVKEGYQVEKVNYVSGAQVWSVKW